MKQEQIYCQQNSKTNEYVEGVEKVSILNVAEETQAVEYVSNDSMNTLLIFGCYKGENL